MSAVVTEFEQAKIEHEARKIVAELVALGGVKWAARTVNQIPEFSDLHQEKLRRKLKEKLGRLCKHVL